MTTAILRLAYGILITCSAGLLSSCGGGGGGVVGIGGGGSTSGPTGTFSLSTNSISFQVRGPYAQAPANQTLTGTVTGLTATSGTLYITVSASHPNDMFSLTTPAISGNTGTLSVIPAVPSSLLAGSFKGTITVSACLNDQSCRTGQLAGSPQNVTVDYEIPSGVDGETITPRVVAANAAGTVILRGAGFTGATSVSFGSTAATSITVVSDSEIDVAYPALAAGTYPVAVNSGSIGYTASLVAVASPALSATVLPYPGGLLNYQGTPGIEYDAQRSAVFVVLNTGNLSETPMLLRYAFDGTNWGTPAQTSMANLVQVHLSPDGTHLLGLVATDSSHTTMVELDPVSMAQTNSTTFANPSGVGGPEGFALENGGNAIIDFGDSYPVVFGTSDHIATTASTGLCTQPPVASGNGAVVAVACMTFMASTEVLTGQGVQTGSETAADFAGDKFINNGAVENQSGQTLGYVFGAYGEILNAAGTRAYIFSSDATTLQPLLATYDLTATPTGSPDPAFPELGPPIYAPGSVSGCAQGCFPQGFSQLALAPDSATIFAAVSSGLWVQPITP